MRTFVILAVCVTSVLSSDTPSRLVTTSQGPVRGYKDSKYEVYVFYSVPYATAPTGVDRFKAPMEPPVWDEPFEAVNKEIICPQFGIDEVTISKNMQEDCLIANIYVPDTKGFKIPVVVYVHGGAFLTGYGHLVDPKALVNTGKVIVVTFNYRLGGHGFLCLGTKDIPGNAGLKDQVAMLRWVQRNIASFGGNPDDVTIAGSSAGSASVDLLMLSKVTKGLFNKGIIESGSNTNTFAVQVDPIRVAKEYATLLDKDINTDDVYALEEFFKTIPVERLNSIYTVNRTDATSLISPCVERDAGEERILDESPFNILQSGNYVKIPLLYGCTNMEGLLRIVFVGGEINEDLERMNKSFSNYLPVDLFFDSENQKNAVAKKIRNFYFGQKIDEDIVMDYINYYSDIYFTLGILKSVNLQVRAGNDQIYLYEYSFSDDNTPYVPYTKLKGADHCTHSRAVWGSDAPSDDETNLTEDYKKIQNNLREIWLNFITTGKPVPEGSKLAEWPPVGKKWSPHMSLGKHLELRGSLLKERADFWMAIYAKHYRTPQPPPPPPHRRTEL